MYGKLAIVVLNVFIIHMIFTQRFVGLLFTTAM